MARLSSSPQEKQAMLDTLRQKFFEDSKFDETNQRYGLFSYSGTLAVSKQPYEIKILPKRSEDGSVVTKPRNFTTQPGKRGKVNDAYFQPPTFISVGDRYKNPRNVVRNEKERAELARKIHEQPLKLGSEYKEKTSLFEHLPCDVEKKINRRLEDGSVRIDNKNFYTSPAKKGIANATPGVMLQPFPKYIDDPYERKTDLVREYDRREKAKIIHEHPMKSTDHGNRTFSNDKTTFYDTDIVKKPRRPQTSRVYPHERPFRPSNPPKRGVFDKTLQKFPKYVEDPPKQATRRPTTESVPWRRSYDYRSKPSPSITRMRTNVRAEISRNRSYFRQ